MLHIHKEISMILFPGNQRVSNSRSKMDPTS